MMKTVDAILRGPLPHFGTDGVLYMPGQIVPDVPAEQVSKHDSREETVEVRELDGTVRTRKVQRHVQFRPLGAAQKEALARARREADEADAEPAG